MKKPSMITQIAIAVVVGILVGLLIPASGNYLKIVGDVFLRLMQMAIPILILGQIVQAVGSINPNNRCFRDFLLSCRFMGRPNGSHF